MSSSVAILMLFNGSDCNTCPLMINSLLYRIKKLTITFDSADQDIYFSSRGGATARGTWRESVGVRALQHRCRQPAEETVPYKLSSQIGTPCSS